MRAVRQFNVIPAIPTRLAALATLANNIHWTWDRRTQALFAQLDPALWESSGHDPIRLIAGITASRWAELADDHEIASLTDAAAGRLAQATTEPRWFQSRGPTARSSSSPTSHPSSASPRRFRSTRAASESWRATT